MVISTTGPQLPDDPQQPNHDPRLLENGRVIQSSGYSDQPYLVVTRDGAWLCVVTSSDSHEGDASQRIVTRRSSDQGLTWSDPVDIEPAEGPEASWAIPLVVPSGRIYVFYTYNSANIREVVTDTGTSPRVDTLGDMVFRYSDDDGRSWSEHRYVVPIREFDIDRENPYRGAIRFWWSVGKPEIVAGSVYIAGSKVGGFREESQGFQRTSEGFLLRSDNLLTEPDPAKIDWTTLPDGEKGLVAPAGEVAEEHKAVGLRSGGLYCTFRSERGYVADAYSRDGGHSWTEPEWARFGAGAPIKNPRAATFVWACGDGRYLLWFHNNSNTWFGTYRNPAWLSGGREVDGEIVWSQPEIAIYADDPMVSMSYPDLIEDRGDFFVTETEKRTARVHRLDRDMLDGLWGAPSARLSDALVYEFDSRRNDEPPATPPRFTPFQLRRGNWQTEDARGGVTMSAWLRVGDLTPGRLLVDSRNDQGVGIALQLESRGRLRFLLNDGQQECSWVSDPGAIEAGRLTHVGVIVDGGPKIILFVVDGVLHDGGAERPYGWGRFSRNLRDVSSGLPVALHGRMRGEVVCLRLYDRALRVAEVVQLSTEDVRSPETVGTV